MRSGEVDVLGASCFVAVALGVARGVAAPALGDLLDAGAFQQAALVSGQRDTRRGCQQCAEQQQGRGRPRREGAQACGAGCSERCDGHAGAPS